MSFFARIRLFAIVILFLTSPGAATATPTPATAGLCEVLCNGTGALCVLAGYDPEFCAGFAAGCVHGCSLEP